MKKDPENEFEKSLLNIQNQLTAIRELPLQIQNHISLLEKQLSDLISHKIKSTETSVINEEDIVINDEQQQEYLVEQESNAENQHQEMYDEDDVFETTVDEMIDGIEQMESSGISGENHDEEDEDKEPSGRPMYPLTPLPRPIVLPGGRKWRSPKDAYNEKFIAETLISQAEVLVGSTLG